MLPLFLALLAAQSDPGPGALAEEWPQAQAGRVLATPDWSDYRVYPKRAAAKDEEGRVVPELLVDATGEPQACRIVETSNFPDLDFGTCQLMMQMRFEPARDAAGAPVASHYRRGVVWLLEDARPFASGEARIRLNFSNGHVGSCTTVGGNGPYVALWSALACPVFGDVSFYFGPAAARDLRATAEVRLDAGDGAPFLSEPWPAGEPITSQKIAFTINKQGDPSQCTIVESQGLGARGLNNMSPCGGLLSSLWFSNRRAGPGPRSGTMEIRVYALDQ